MTNLTVDIIYYKTSSDFELEFNLSGCCRMRIFKDKIDDRRELVTALARDVSRSRVIIMVSDLYGEKNGAQTLSAAIGYKYAPLDKAAYSIKNDGEIFIPSGAIPLVTKSGQFGGCIIECGKQSIIVVTSERALRHEIMRSYIHQYIFDINQVEAYNERLRHESENNPVIDGSNILTAARKEFTGELPSVVNGSAVTTPTTENSVAVDAPDGVVLPVEIDGNPKADDAEESSNVKETEVLENCDETDSVTAEESSEISDNEAEGHISTDVTESEEDVSDTDADLSEDFSDDEDDETKEEFIPPVIEISSKTAGFEIPDEILDEFKEKKINRRIFRRRKGTDIALLVIAILLLVGFGLLAYFLVYLPIISGEMPNSLNEIIEAIL